MRLILASESPRRREILHSLGVDFEAENPCVEEIAVPAEAPRDTARRLACLKAAAVSERFPDACVIGADTVVDVDGVPLFKPLDRDDSVRMLKLLNGRTHLVHTGIAIVRFGSPAVSGTETSRVTFGDLSEDEIFEFVSSGDGDDKAGSYAIQGRGALLVERIEGDYYNIVGLPVYRLKKMLEKFTRL
ncbi:MAG: Maf family protein [Synergistaceae bacterium]|nr:Maf family protein [Synergistaceae bacterium]